MFSQKKAKDRNRLVFPMGLNFIKASQISTLAMLPPSMYDIGRKCVENWPHFDPRSFYSTLPFDEKFWKLVVQLIEILDFVSVSSLTNYFSLQLFAALDATTSTDSATDPDSASKFLFVYIFYSFRHDFP